MSLQDAFAHSYQRSIQHFDAERSTLGRGERQIQIVIGISIAILATFDVRFEL